jgi:hypothetical protein
MSVQYRPMRTEELEKRVLERSRREEQLIYTAQERPLWPAGDHPQRNGRYVNPLR